MRDDDNNPIYDATTTVKDKLKMAPASMNILTEQLLEKNQTYTGFDSSIKPMETSYEHDESINPLEITNEQKSAINPLANDTGYDKPFKLNLLVVMEQEIEQTEKSEYVYLNEGSGKNMFVTRFQ